MTWGDVPCVAVSRSMKVASATLSAPSRHTWTARAVMPPLLKSTPCGSVGRVSRSFESGRSSTFGAVVAR